MPLYYCTIEKGSTSFEQRSLVAGEITRIHCETTGAPALFVHAFFAEAPPAELPAGRKVVVLGSIRAGRTPEQKQRLATGMQEAIAAILGCDLDAVRVATRDVPARWVMEGGEILPEPGDEEAWLAKHA